MTVGKDEELQPPLTVLVACMEKHLGLCRVAHDEVYFDALALAKLIFSHVKDKEKGSFIGIHTVQYSNLFCLSMLRFRDPEIAIFAECSIDMRTDTIALAVQEEEFVYETSYGIARDVMLALARAGIDHEVAMTVFSVENDVDTPFLVRIVERSHTILREVGSGVFRAGHGHDGRGGGGGGVGGHHRRRHDASRVAADGQDAHAGDVDLFDVLLAAEDVVAVRPHRRARVAGEGGVRVAAPARPAPEYVDEATEDEYPDDDGDVANLVFDDGPELEHNPRSPSGHHYVIC